jgi:hypothetical protein
MISVSWSTISAKARFSIAMKPGARQQTSAGSEHGN